MTLAEKQDALAAEINALGDCFEQYSYLIFRAGALPPLDQRFKTEEYLVKGCQSVVWTKIDIQNGILLFQADSDTLIIRGILAVLTDLVNGQPVEDIRSTDIDILDRTELAVTFESERMAGIQSILNTIKAI